MKSPLLNLGSSAYFLPEKGRLLLCTNPLVLRFSVNNSSLSLISQLCIGVFGLFLVLLVCILNYLSTF